MASRPGRTLSSAEPSPGSSPPGGAFAGARRRFGLAVAIAITVGSLVGDALHLADAHSLESRPPAHLTLPMFHGQGQWGPGQRPAPRFVLRDQAGATISLSGQLGSPVLIAFLDTRREAGSGPQARSLAEALAILPRAKRPEIDVVGLDPGSDTHAAVGAAAHRWQLREPYHWLSGSPVEIARICHEYGVPASVASDGSRSPVYLVDRSGFERAGFLYPFFPTVLAGDLETLSRRA